MADPVPGWTRPIYQALTAPQLLWGVPRTFAVLLFVGTMASGLYLPLMFVVGAAVWAVAKVATRYDVHAVPIVARHLLVRRRYEG